VLRPALDDLDDRALIGMSARWRLAVRRPIGQFCAHEGWPHGVPVAAPNGGYLRVRYRHAATLCERAGPGRRAQGHRPRRVPVADGCGRWLALRART
jgi:hypothetical protein